MTVYAHEFRRIGMKRQGSFIAVLALRYIQDELSKGNLNFEYGRL